MPQIKDAWDKLIEAMNRDAELSDETLEHIEKDKELKESVTENKRI